jgi:hypothetical protein
MKKVLIAIFVFLLQGLNAAEAGYWDLSLGFNYNRSEFANQSYSWTRRYGVSMGYHFTETSTIEFSLQDSYDRNKYTGYEDSTYHDRVYSVNWVQAFSGKEDLFQPYVKGGVGVLNRDAMIVDSIGRSQESQTDSITGVIGLGLRIRLTQTLGLRMEGTSYLSGGRISTWRDNFAATFGASFYF